MIFTNALHTCVVKAVQYNYRNDMLAKYVLSL